MRKITKGARATRARNKNVASGSTHALSQERQQKMRQGMRRSKLERQQIAQRLRDRPRSKTETTAGALRLRDACQYLGGIHPATMRRAIARGLIRPNRLFRHLLFPVSELDRVIREGMVS